MNNAAVRTMPAALASVVAWLTPRRLYAQAIVLSVCLWGTCAVDFATPGLLDRAGNVKFQDFLPLYISGRLISQSRASELYEQQVITKEIRSVVCQPTPLRLPMLYGPQVGLPFVPLSRLSFMAAAWVWATASVVAFFACIYFMWRACPALRPRSRLVAISAAAFPPLFHFFVRGQNSVLVLACFAAAFLMLRAKRGWLAGIALGFLVFKPQFLVGIPLVLLLAGTWKILAGLCVSAAAQLGLAWLYFGSAVMRAYLDTLWHISRWIATAELEHAPIQMHSLRSFWVLLMPWKEVALMLYIVSAVVVVGVAAAVWKSASPLPLRFSALTLAAVLTNPHLFIYDLLVLAPALLLLVDWGLSNPQDRTSGAVQLLSYLVFVLPLCGPLSHWTHVQLSVPALVVLLGVIWRSTENVGARGLGSAESGLAG